MGKIKAERSFFEPSKGESRRKKGRQNKHVTCRPPSLRLHKGVYASSQNSQLPPTSTWIHVLCFVSLCHGLLREIANFVQWGSPMCQVPACDSMRREKSRMSFKALLSLKFRVLLSEAAQDSLQVSDNNSRTDRRIGSRHENAKIWKAQTEEVTQYQEYFRLESTDSMTVRSVRLDKRYETSCTYPNSTRNFPPLAIYELLVTAVVL